MKVALRRGRPRIYETSYYSRHRERLLTQAKERYRARKFVATFPKDLVGLPAEYVRFWRHVEIKDAEWCWEWQGRRNEKGYGLASVNGAVVKAHRVAWELVQQRVIPGDMCILHRCDNPPCCNPFHLLLGTIQDNFKDACKKGRPVLGNLRGERHPRVKLTAAKVAWIRLAYVERGRTWAAVEAIAEELQVSPQHVNNILKGRY